MNRDFNKGAWICCFKTKCFLCFLSYCCKSFMLSTLFRPISRNIMMKSSIYLPFGISAYTFLKCHSTYTFKFIYLDPWLLNMYLSVLVWWLLLLEKYVILSQFYQWTRHISCSNNKIELKNLSLDIKRAYDYL